MAKNPDYCRVGRWMSPDELAKMLKSGQVQESLTHRGVTSVAFPANRDAYKNPPPGDVYVEFFVPCNRLLKIPGGWGKIYGPNSSIGRARGILDLAPAYFPQILTPWK